jgi:hydroxyacylglutathione hydrolase
MTNIKAFVFNPFQENTYIIYDESKECIIVDAGCYNEKELGLLDAFIQLHKLIPVRLINTHGHVDHVLGSQFVGEKYNLKPEYHFLDEILVKQAVEQGKMFGLEVQEPLKAEKYLNEGDVIYFGKTEISILHVPGHSQGSVALYCKAGNFVVTGDVLFKSSIGRTDLYGGDYNALIDSISNKLMVLPDDTRVYPGHGPETSIYIEKNTNPFLIEG